MVKRIEAKMHLFGPGKRRVAIAMYEKGRHFIGAAALARTTHLHEAVVLYNFCQGYEVMVKGLLLIKDFDKYEPQLRKPLGHNLPTIARAAVAEFGLNPLHPMVFAEMTELNKHYGASQNLRYGSIFDILVNPNHIPSNAFINHVLAVARVSWPYVMAEAQTVGLSIQQAGPQPS